MTVEFKADHLQIINRVLKQHPRVAESIATVSAVVARAKFPINSFYELGEAMGGGSAHVDFAGRSFALAELEKHIPVYYFPIANENDLIAKIGDLAKQMPNDATTAPPKDMHSANINPLLLAAKAERPATPAPTLSLDEMHKMAGFTARPAPGVGGIHR